FDRPGALFYLDPPYWGCETDYGADVFSPADFTKLAGMLAKIQGKFVLSINDVPEIRAMFAGFEMRAVDLSYTVSGRGATDARELIIGNCSAECLARRDEADGLSGRLL